MRTNSLITLFILSCLFCIPFKGKGQATKKNELILAAREIIKEAGSCALITLDEQSLPMVRTMDPFLPEEDFTIWLGTNKNSRKVNQIKNNPNVTLYYQEQDNNGYVVVHGKAQIVDDAAEKQHRWKEAWEDFYPNNRESYTLIKVSPDWMEILSVSRNIMGDSITWKTPIVKLK